MDLPQHPCSDDVIVSASKGILQIHWRIYALSERLLVFILVGIMLPWL